MDAGLGGGRLIGFLGDSCKPNSSVCIALGKRVAHQPICRLLGAYLDANSNSMQKPIGGVGRFAVFRGRKSF